MNRLKQLVGESKAIFAAVLGLLAVVLLVPSAQAATISWSMNNVQEGGKKVNGGMYFLVNENITRDSIQALAGKGAKAFKDALGASSAHAFEWEVADGVGNLVNKDPDQPSLSTLGINEATTYKFYALVFDTETITGKSNYYLTALKSYKTGQGEANTSVYFGSQATQSAASGAWMAVGEDAIPVTYVDAAGQEQTTNAVVVEASTLRVTWDAGWYVVTNEVTVAGGADCNGEVHLILADAGALTISGVVNNQAGIAVTNDNSFAIYGQTEGTGSLTVSGGTSGAGIGGGDQGTGSNITINGGLVTATGGSSGAGIGGGNYGAGSNITINGGTVMATSNFRGSGIGGGSGKPGSYITINGGTVTAIGGPDEGSASGSGIGSGFVAGMDNSNNIFVSGDVVLKAGTSPNPTTEIKHDSTTDVASSLAYKRYVTVESLLSTEPIVSAPTAVAHSTYSVYTNGLLSADGTVWSNRTATVVYTADAGYIFKNGGMAFTNKLDTSKNPAVVLSGEVLPVAVWNQRKPDYTQAKDWMLNSTLKPTEAKEIANEPAEDSGVDVFYIYPTVAMTNATTTVDGFVDIDDPQLRGDEATHTGDLWNTFNVQAKVFADFTHVYAPFYRQVSFERALEVATAAGMADGNQAFVDYLHDGVAYADVVNALDTYFATWNKGRPFILASHSQGSAMMRNVIEHYFTLPENKNKLDRLVACYALGFGVTKDWMAQIEKATDGKLCLATNATDSGVYVTWNVVGPDSKPYPNLLVPSGAVAVNPLTWTTNTTPAEASLNLGALTNVAVSAVVPHLYDATVDAKNGVVVCVNLPSSRYVQGVPAFGDQSLHMDDYQAYWENLRLNAYQRIETATGRKPRCGTPTDYSDAANWMNYPATADKPVDVFYLYPTCVPGTCKTLIGEIEEGMKTAANEHYKKGPSTFESYANVYAPYYRQGSGLALISDLTPDGIQRFGSTHVVKTDVFAALDYYFANRNPGAKRPFILASHSQGSANMKNVFEEYFVGEKKQYLGKMVAAYVLGYKITPDWCKKVGVDFAEGESDTGVVMTWNAEGPGASSDNFLTSDPAQLAINPINWKTDTTEAVKAENLGSVVTNAQGVLTSVKPGVTGARLQAGRAGAVIVDAPETIPVGISPGFGTKSYHFEDWAFFHDNIGANGFKRYASLAGLVRVSTNSIPTVANATWKVLVDGQAVTVSPVDGELFVPKSATDVKVVYTLDADKVAEGQCFANGETSASFAMKYDCTGSAWIVLDETKAEIGTATKVGKPTLQLGVVAQRYPWNGMVDVQYRATFWPASNVPLAAIELSVGETSLTNEIEVVGAGEVSGSTVFDVKAIAPNMVGKARVRGLAFVPTTPVDVRRQVSPAEGGTVTGGMQCAWGTEVEITAVPNEDYVFAGWADGVQTEKRTVTVDGTRYQANFIRKLMQTKRMGMKADAYPFFDQTFCFATNGIADACSPYKDWAASFYISFSKPIPAKSLKLATRYVNETENWDQSIKGDILEAGKEHQIADAGTFGDFCQTRKSLDFAVWAYDNQNLDTTMTVWLKLTNGVEQVKQKLADYTFEELVKVIIRPSGLTEPKAPYAIKTGDNYYTITNFNYEVTDKYLTMTGLKGGETVQLNYQCAIVSNANENTTFLAMGYPRYTSKGTLRYAPAVIPDSMIVCKGYNPVDHTFDTAIGTNATPMVIGCNNETNKFTSYWTSYPRLCYAVQRTTSLDNPSWTVVSSIEYQTTNTQYDVRFFDTKGTKDRYRPDSFYRVQVANDPAAPVVSQFIESGEGQTMVYEPSTNTVDLVHMGAKLNDDSVELVADETAYSAKSPCVKWTVNSSDSTVTFRAKCDTIPESVTEFSLQRQFSVVQKPQCGLIGYQTIPIRVITSDPMPLEGNWKRYEVRPVKGTVTKGAANEVVLTVPLNAVITCDMTVREWLGLAK